MKSEERVDAVRLVGPLWETVASADWKRQISGPKLDEQERGFGSVERGRLDRHRTPVGAALDEELTPEDLWLCDEEDDSLNGTPFSGEYS